jgi:nucleotide-binding universal stress UspA family protein
MFRSILLPLDGSSFAEEAVPMAAFLARSAESELWLTHVIRPAPDVDFKTPTEDLEWRNQLQEASSHALGAIASRLRRTGVPAHAEVREGRVLDALLDAEVDHGTDLVVLTTHGAGGFRRWWLGSVADTLLRRGNAPMLLVRPWDDTADREPGEPRFRRVLVPFDGSEEGAAVLPYAAWFRDRFGAKLIFVRVTPSPLEVGSLYGIPAVRLEGDHHRIQKEAAGAELEAMAGRLAPPTRAGSDPEHSPELRVVEASSAAEGILETARVQGADLIILATRGRGGLGRTLLGSVADKVIRGAAVPVLAVRPGDAES